MTQLGKAAPRLLCSLVHKFGKKGVDDFDAFIQELKDQPSPAVGELFIFVDECPRTQSGRLHQTMKALLPDAVFIGFTGTPLLKKDKATSLEVFGNYIHTYKFGEAVEDEVVLDLVYEARDIEQQLGSQSKIDAWFDAKTKGLNDWQKAALREQWGTMQKVLSSRSRMERVVEDIMFDFGVKPRLASQRGNAMLVASSIYEATKYFSLFQKTVFKGKCAVITSYNPQAQDVTKEEIGANTETEKQFLYNTYIELLKNVEAKPGKAKTESYEDDAKSLFISQPANMRLLIVVDKLLTGFDAPSRTYLYIDKSMQDHGLFQAICRTNRLDGDDKSFGYIVDYKDLFKKLVNDKGTNDRFGRFKRGIPPKSKADFAFILHMIETAKPGSGRVAVVVPHGVLFRGAAEGAIRRQLIEENLLDCVIGLPANLFFGTGIPAAILLFDKGKNTRTPCSSTPRSTSPKAPAKTNSAPRTSTSLFPPITPSRPSRNSPTAPPWRKSGKTTTT